MIPSPAHHDIADSLATYAELPSKFFCGLGSRSVQSPDLDNIRFGQARSSKHTAAGLSILVFHVAQIVLDCAQEQVIGAHTHSIVASMANQFSLLYRAIRQFVCDAVSTFRVCAAETKSAVPGTGILMARPKPAAVNIGLVNLAPKATIDIFDRWNAFGSVILGEGSAVFRCVGGMIVHSNSLLSAVAHATGRFQSSRWQLYWVAQEYCTTF